MAVVNTHIQYLAQHELYEKEKPYMANFPVPEGERLTNHVFEKAAVTIRDCRDIVPDLDKNGFTFIEYATSLDPADFDSEQLVLTKYFEELEYLIKQEFPRYEVVFLDFKVRKRSKEFPVPQLHKYPFAQPLLMAHVDMTARDAYGRLGRLPHEKFEELKHRKFEIINIWRLLRGPSSDYPIAMCDFQSLDLSTDTIACDNLYVDSPRENLLLFKNPNHRWYFLHEQKPEEVLVFRNTSSSDPPRKPSKCLELL